MEHDACLKDCNGDSRPRCPFSLVLPRYSSGGVDHDADDDDLWLGLSDADADVNAAVPVLAAATPAAAAHELVLVLWTSFDAMTRAGWALTPC